MNYSEGLKYSAISSSSYITVVIISFLGFFLGLILVKEMKVIRSDGSSPSVTLKKWDNEFRELLKIYKNKYLWLLAPLFISNVWHEVILFSIINAKLFNIRTRSLNTCFVFKKVVDAFIILKKRIMAVMILMISNVAIATICSAIILQSKYMLLHRNEETNKFDFVGYNWLYTGVAFFAYGSLETIGSSLILWLLAELDIETIETRSRLIGLSRSFINLGGCISWLIDITNWFTPNDQWIINLGLWVLATTGIVVIIHNDKL